MFCIPIFKDSSQLRDSAGLAPGFPCSLVGCLPPEPNHQRGLFYHCSDPIKLVHTSAVIPPFGAGSKVSDKVLVVVKAQYECQPGQSHLCP